MFAIGGNMHVSAYKDTKYEPLDIILEAQEEVGNGDSLKIVGEFKCVIKL